MDPTQFNQMLASYSPTGGGAAGGYPTDVPSILAAANPSQFTAQAGPDTTAQATEAAAQPKKKKGNFFTNALPTIGSIGGGILGAVFGGGVGGVGGAAGGSALGKFIENELEGNGAGDGVAGAAVEGGVGQVMGGAAGKLLGKGAQLAKGAATKAIEGDAAKAAIEKRAVALKDVSPQLQKAYNANKALDHVTGMGFDETNPDDVLRVATSSNDVLNDVLNRSLAASGPVDLGHYAQIVKDALAKQGGTLGSFDKVALARGRLGTANTPASQLLSQLEDLGAGTAKTQADPNEIRELTSKLGNLLADNKPTVTAATGAKDPVQVARYNAIKEVRDAVKKSLYDRPELNDSIKGEIGNLTAEDVGSQALADHLNGVITKAGTGNGPAAQDLLDAISHNISINDLGREMQAVRGIGSSTGGQARAAMDAGIPSGKPAGNSVNQAADLVGMGGAALGRPVAAAGTVLTHAAQNPAILETLSRIGKLGEKVAPSAGAALATANGALNDQVSGTGDIMPTDSMPVPATQPQAPGGGLDQQSLLALALYSPSAFSSLIAPSADQQAKVVAANNAETALSGLEGHTPDQGLLSSVMGHFGLGDTGAYQRKAQNAAQAVAAATGTDAGTVEHMLTNYAAGGGNLDEAIRQLLANVESVKRGNTNTAYQSLMNFQGAPVAAH